MFIKSERKEVFYVTLNDVNYHFKPNENGVLVCEIPEDEAEILLKNPRYQPFGKEKPVANPKPKEGLKYPKALSWTNKKANAYAEDVLGINPKSTNDIERLAAEAKVELTNMQQPSVMIKEYVAAVGLAEGSESLED